MKTDVLIGEAIRHGLAGLTLYPTQDGRWQASTTTDRLSWAIHLHADPVSALQAALTDFAPAVSVMTTDNEGIFG